MTLVRDISTALRLNDENFKGSTAPMVDVGMYESKGLNTGEITPEESFTNTHAEKYMDHNKSILILNYYV